MPVMNNLTGKVFGRLTVVSRAGSNKGYTVWNTVCTCGNTKVVLGHSLVKGATRSCGCLYRDAVNEGRVGRPNKDFDTDRIIELYNEGYSYRSIQQVVDVNLRTISMIINANKDKLTRGQHNGGRPRKQ